MQEFSAATKAEVKEICSHKSNDLQCRYGDLIDTMEANGVNVRFRMLFQNMGKQTKHIGAKKRYSLVLCAFVYPAEYSEDTSIRKHKCQCCYSQIGRIVRTKDNSFHIQINEKEDKTMTLFLERCAKRLTQMPADAALKDRLPDVLYGMFCVKRRGSSFNKTYRGIPVYVAWVIILLIALLILRIISPGYPLGYHSSLHESLFFQ